MLRRGKIQIGNLFYPRRENSLKMRDLFFARDNVDLDVAKAAVFQKIVQAHFVEVFARFVLALAQRKFKRGAIRKPTPLPPTIRVQCRNAAHDLLIPCNRAALIQCFRAPLLHCSLVPLTAL